MQDLQSRTTFRVTTRKEEQSDGRFTVIATFEPYDMADLALGVEKAISADDMKALARQLRDIDRERSRLTEAAEPNPWEPKPFDEPAARNELADQDDKRRREAINAELRSETQIPFALSCQTSATYNYSRDQAAQALALHVKPGRPKSSFFNNLAEEWDARKTELEQAAARWDRACSARDRAEQAARAVDDATFESRLDVLRKERAAMVMAAGARRELAGIRFQHFIDELARIELVIGSLNPDKQAELRRQQQGHGHGR